MGPKVRLVSEPNYLIRNVSNQFLDLTSNWIFQQLNIDNLHDQNLSFKGKSSDFVDVENRRYETSVTKKKSTLTMLLPDDNGKVHTGNKKITLLVFFVV